MYSYLISYSDVVKLVIPPGEAIPSYSVMNSVENELKNRSAVCKKACLCVNRFYRDNPDVLSVEDSDWVSI